MAKITIPAVTSKKVAISLSAANPYLSADGQVDIVAFGKLAKKIASANDKADELASMQPRGKAPKNATPIFYTRKEVVKYSASLEKKNDHKYKVLRGQQIKFRTKMPTAESNIKLKVLLPATAVGIDKVTAAEVKKAISAIAAHNKKAIKIVDKVKVEKAKTRDAANAEFDTNVQEMTDILNAGGINASNIAIGQSMFGKVVHVKLPSGGVISIGKSDIAKFRAAKKTAAAK